MDWSVLKVVFGREFAGFLVRVIYAALGALAGTQIPPIQ